MLLKKNHAAKLRTIKNFSYSDQVVTAILRVPLLVDLLHMSAKNIIFDWASPRKKTEDLVYDDCYTDFNFVLVFYR